MFMPACLGKKTPAGSQAFGVGTTGFTVPDGYLTLTVTVLAAGGGGAQELGPPNGGAGGNSSVVGTGCNMLTYGGAGGLGGAEGDIATTAAHGGASGGTTNTTGGGGAGGAGQSFYFDGFHGQNGGNGGYSSRVFLPGELIEGSSLTVTVGAKGAAYGSSDSVNGSATISWT